MQRFLDIDGTRLHLDITGQGPPMVLVHGGPGSFNYFTDSPFIDWLAPHRTVCSYDQRGCRQSTSDGPFNLQVNIDDLDAIRRHLDTDQFDLLGHSWGGYLALRYAVAHPNNVRRLILLTPIGAREGWNIDFHRNINNRHRGEQLTRLNELKKKINQCHDLSQRQELYRRQSELAMPSYMAEEFRHLAPKVEFFNRHLSNETVHSMYESYKEPGWETKLAALPCPVLLIHGIEDPLPAYIIDQLQEMIPHAQVARLQGCGHFPWREKPDLLRDVLLPFILSDPPQTKEDNQPCE